MKNSVIVTGSRGLIGRSVCKHLEGKNWEVKRLDFVDGHDLTDENFVKDYFSKNSASALVNLFALNHHITDDTTRINIFDIPLDSFRQYMEVNLTALFSVCREFARQNKKGSIVNFSSTYGVVSPRKDLYGEDEKHVGYSVSKSGVLGLSKHLATHLAPHIRVNTIIPGGVLNNQPEEFIKKYNKNTPFGRMMDVNELVGIVEFLVNNDSSYMTGSEIKVDGGWTAW